MTLTRRQILALTSALVALPGLGFADTTDTAAAPDTIQDFGIGDPAAKVQIHEYLSFTCPHCRHFHDEVYPRLKAEYIDTGKARLTYHEVFFDKYGLWGAMLARCGGEMRYVGIVDMLYDKQTDWVVDDPAAAVAELKKFGAIAGIDEATADACLKDQEVAKTLVAHYQSSVAEAFPNDSFQGTPSFIINGTTHGNMPWEELKQIIEDELAK